MRKFRTKNSSTFALLLTVFIYARVALPLDEVVIEPEEESVEAAPILEETRPEIPTPSFAENLRLLKTPLGSTAYTLAKHDIELGIENEPSGEPLNYANLLGTIHYGVSDRVTLGVMKPINDQILLDCRVNIARLTRWWLTERTWIAVPFSQAWGNQLIFTQEFVATYASSESNRTHLGVVLGSASSGDYYGSSSAVKAWQTFEHRFSENHSMTFSVAEEYSNFSETNWEYSVFHDNFALLGGVGYQYTNEGFTAFFGIETGPTYGNDYGYGYFSFLGRLHANLGINYRF